jgi:carboxylesterase type B
MLYFLVLAEALLAYLVVDVAADWTVGQEVRTSSGLVQGKPAALKGSEAVSEYLSIPYAAQPVGPLRWKAPQKFNSTAKVDATKWGPGCPISGGLAGSTSAAKGLTGGTTAEESEACLSLNVWTRPQSGEKKKAVLLSIYGGGFNTGSSNTPYLNGAPLANREDVVVVSMNYRLNIFGFPGAPGLPEQNLGMLDIRAAAEWTRDNIAAFGGDPTRITLFGESAGGGATDYYAFAWPEDPIVNGFIPQSGSVFTRGIAAESNEKAWFKASAALGCGGAEAGVKSTECMQGKPWKDVMKYVDTGMRQPGKTFGPVFDERVIFKDYNTRVKGGHFAKRVRSRFSLSMVPL